MNVLELFDSAGLHYTQKEEDHAYIECWNCGKDNLSVNTFTGAWHCWSLGCEDIKGGFHKLAKELSIDTAEFTPMKAPPKVTVFTDEDRDTIINSNNNRAPVIEWAVSRSLDPDFVLKEGIGYDENKKAIVIPYKDEKGRLIGARYRSTIYDSQWTVGREPDLYVLDPNDLDRQKIIIVEGEPDALTLKQMGLPCVAILGSRKDNGYRSLRKARRIYLGHDMDGAGEAGAQKAAAILGPYRCHRVTWTSKDANDMLKAGATKEDFVACLETAESCATDLKSKSGRDAVKNFLSAKKQQGQKRKSWGWDRLNTFTKGIIPGWTIYMMAKGGAGKTTWLLNLAMNQVEQGVKVGIASYEEDADTEITPKLLAMIVGRNPGGGEFDPREIEMADEEMGMIQVFDGDRTPDAFKEWVRECYYVHGTTFFVADYLQMVVDDTSPKTLVDTAYAVGKDLCKELPGINIVWAVQPKLLQKQMNKGEKVVAKIDGSDARGGSVIEQACDVFLVMSPVDKDTTQYEFTKVRGQLIVSKRDWLGQITQLEYDHATLRLVELKNLDYGGANGN